MNTARAPKEASLENQLENLIAESGVTASRFDDGRFNVVYSGQTRPLNIIRVPA